MKKFIGFIITLSIIFSFGITAFSFNDLNSNNAEYQEYLKYVKEGYLGDDITFEIWKNAKDESIRLEKELENNPEYKLVYDSDQPSVRRYHLRAGDIFITNGTSSAGFFGHAGIAINSREILHIAGINKKVDCISLSKWHAEYTNDNSKSWTKVFRNTYSHVAQKAANWAINTYKNNDVVKYKITLDRWTIFETYCSKIVWQSYYYGGNKTATGGVFGLVTPFELPSKIRFTTLWTEF